jgi:putative FmdB family regulatory protein
MPFYEYHCSKCGHHHEELQKVTDKPLKKCPECGRNTLKRLVSAPVFRLKGGGWYETDFKSDKESKRNIAGEKDHVEAKADAADKPKEVAVKKDETKASPAKATVPVKKPARSKASPRKPASKPPRAAHRAR